jgi:uncharacterized protein
MSEDATEVGVDSAASRTERYGPVVERQDGRDFPFYNGDPLGLAVWQWGLVIVGCAAGFAVLSLYPATTNVQSLVPRFLFGAIPLAVLIAFTRTRWTAILHGISGRDVLVMIGFAAANLVVSFIVGLVVKVSFGAASNPATNNVHGADEVVTFYVGTAMQLFGEELFSILPFLAVMAFCFRGGTSRRTAVLVAWLVTAAWFGAAHLPTYQWNFAQAFLVIGVARLVLTLAYIRTKNIFVSTGAHILNDWVIFTITLVVAALHP